MNRIQVIIAGLRDGWEQPDDLSSSTSVPDEHQELLDMAINLGQVARRGRHSQPYLEGFWPFGHETTAVSWKRRLSDRQRERKQ